MKLLWVKLGGLVPLDTGGKIRSYHIAKELAKNNEVTLFTAYPAHDNDLHPSLKDIFKNVVLCPLDLPPKRGLFDTLNYIFHLGSKLPYGIRANIRPAAAAKLRDLLKSESFDIVLADFIFGASLIPADVKIPVVI